MAKAARRVLLGMAVVAALAGCTAEPTPEPAAPDEGQAATEDVTEDRAPDDETTDDETTEPEQTVEQILERAHAKDVDPDAEVMATMSAVPFGEDALADHSKLRQLGVFEQAVSVEVTQKDGATWWVVVADSAGEDGGTWTRQAWLTNALGSADYWDGGTWIELPKNDPWKNVDWDDELLVRGASALAVANEALGDLG